MLSFSASTIMFPTFSICSLDNTKHSRQQHYKNKIWRDYDTKDVHLGAEISLIATVICDIYRLQRSMGAIMIAW